MPKVLHICLLCIFALPITAQDWKLVKEKEDIQVFTRKSDNSKYKEVKILAKIQTTMNELVAALEDVDKHKDWVPYTIESYMVDKLDDDKFYYYVSSDFPFPAKDRDVVIYYERSQHKSTNIVITQSTASPEYLETFDKYVRVPLFNSTYTLTPMDDGYIDIKYELKVSPGGSIPAWIINLGVTKGPIKTMESLFDLIKAGTYKHYDVAGIVD